MRYVRFFVHDIVKMYKFGINANHLIYHHRCSRKFLQCCVDYDDYMSSFGLFLIMFNQINMKSAFNLFAIKYPVIKDLNCYKHNSFKG